MFGRGGFDLSMEPLSDHDALTLLRSRAMSFRLLNRFLGHMQGAATSTETAAQALGDFVRAHQSEIEASPSLI